MEAHEQLREVALRVDPVAAAGAGEAREDGGGAPAARLPDEQRVLAIGNVLIDAHFDRRALRQEGGVATTPF